MKLRIYGSQGMSWGDTSFVGLVLESTSGTIAKLIYFGADAKRSKNTEGTVVNSILVFTSTCGGLKKVTNAWTPLVALDLGSLGSLGSLYDSWPINRKEMENPWKIHQNMASLENSSSLGSIMNTSGPEPNGDREKPPNEC